MLTRVFGDISTFPLEPRTCIPHIVNNQGVAGSGLVMGIEKRWPSSIRQYEDWFWEGRCGEFQLGQVDISQQGDNVVAHMLAQRAPGGYYIDGVYIRPIVLEALEECMLRVRVHCLKHRCQIVTGEFGGMRAGASFEEEIIPMINKIWGNLDVTILSYKE